MNPAGPLFVPPTGSPPGFPLFWVFFDTGKSAQVLKFSFFLNLSFLKSGMRIKEQMTKD